jgi:hypothetical protein
MIPPDDLPADAVIDSGRRQHRDLFEEVENRIIISNGRLFAFSIVTFH